MTFHANRLLTGYDISCKLSPKESCPVFWEKILFSGTNKKNIIKLSSAENVVKVNLTQQS